MGNLKSKSILDLFEEILAGVTLAIFVCLLPSYSWYFGVDSHFIINKFLNGSPKPVLLDLLTYFPSFTVWTLGGLFLSNGLTILGYSNGYLRVVKAIAIYWLHQRLWVIGDGGMNLLVLSQLFLCLKDIPFVSSEKRESLNDALVWLLKGQFILIYITAFFSKMSGAEWVQGEALGIVVQIDKFESHFLHNLFLTFPWVEKIGTIGVVLLQGLLPLVLCFGRGRVKAFIILLGVSMHFGIAIHMGLIGFSAIMISHYALFWEPGGVKMFEKSSWHLSHALAASLIIFNFLSLGLVKSTIERTEIFDLEKSHGSVVGQTVPYASITKLFTLALVDSLQAQGKINIDKEYETPAGVFRIRDLASFRAGVVDDGIDKDQLAKFNWQSWREYFHVGPRHIEYSNFSYALIQYILETRLQMDLEGLFEEHLHFSRYGIRPTSAGHLPFNIRTMGAFGLEGPLSSLSLLKGSLASNGFCFKSAEFCLEGTSVKGGVYFLGDHGFNQLYVVISNSGTRAVNTWNQSYRIAL